MMEEEFSAAAMKEISMRAKVVNMRVKYSDIVDRINKAAHNGESEIILKRSEEFQLSYELFNWLEELGFCITYIRKGCDIKCNLWDNSTQYYDYFYADWIRIAW